MTLEDNRSSQFSTKPACRLSLFGKSFYVRYLILLWKKMLGPKPIRPIHHYILPGLFVLGLFVILIIRTPDSKSLKEYNGQIMGTYWIVKTINGTPDLQKEIHDQLNDINSKMSTYLPQSEISQFNIHLGTDPFPISKETLDVVQAAQKISTHSQGAFDISIKPLVDIWGFGAKAVEAPPEESEIALAMGKVGYDQLHIMGIGLKKDTSELEIDLSAIAKGYAVDRIAILLEKKGYTDYMVDIGGEIRAKGKNTKDRYWRIGIETPDGERGSYTDVIELNSMSIATSGDYRNFYEQDGKRISHTIDARSGLPITHRLASVSVLHPSAMMADGWATALNVVGPEEAIKIANEQNLNIMLIVRTEKGEHETEYSNQFERYRITKKTDPE
jgi:thiamine biosynthesis lipoprotein